MFRSVTGVLGFLFTSFVVSQNLVLANSLTAQEDINKFQSPRELARDFFNKSQKKGRGGGGQENVDRIFPNLDQPAIDDSELVNAVTNHKDSFFARGVDMTVIRILPDDTSGLQHQRWYVKLSNGASVYAVYNVDITERVPVEVGQKMNMGGEFKYTSQGPLLHWLHEDPQNRRPDGYVEVNGQMYGKVIHPNR